MEIAWGELQRKERDRSADEGGWDVKRGNSLTAARTETRVPDELRRKERDRSAGRAWMGCEAWK